METKMETTFLLLLFFVAHAATLGEDSDLKCSLRTKEAERGKNVTLDCYCEPRCNVTDEDLKWRFYQTIYVLVYRGTSDTGRQNAHFKDRAHLTSTEGLQDGNFPVTISTVSEIDEGIYTCQVGSKTCRVELRLKDPEFQLKCPEETIKAQVGQNVTLNCESEPQQDLTEEIIKWRFKSTIFFYFKGKSPYEPEQFKDRVHTASSWNASEGKLSVEISSVNESDAGVYTCSVISGAKCTVTLIVDRGTEEDKHTTGAQEGNPTPTSDGSNTGAIIGIVVGVVVGAVIVAGLIYRNNRTRRGRQRDERRSPQDNQEDAPLETFRDEPSPNAGE